MKLIFACLLLFSTLYLPLTASANDQQLESCIQKQLRTADDDKIIGEIRSDCETRLEMPESGALIDKRRLADRDKTNNLLSLVPHKPNYFIGGYYFLKPQTKPFEIQHPDQDINIDTVELKFQISLKTMIYEDLFGQTGDLWVSYTNRSFWQAFNSSNSSPFRETNHEPEVWIDFATDLNLGVVKFRGGNVGMVHQSNGQFGALSRSWNRIYAHLVFQNKDVYFAIKPWWRIPENIENDDNPDIEDYLGNFELYAIKDWGRQTLGIMVRNNLRFDDNNHGALQLDYTFPLHNQMRGYVQWFYGYGESLIDYDHKVNTLSFGIMLANWL